MKMFFHFLVQMMLFYIVPLFMKSLGPIGMVFVILLGTFINALLFGILSKKWVRFFFPFTCGILFIPSVFIFYNSSALVHALWYFVVSSFGLLIGAVLSGLRTKYKEKGE